jgi:hypothetical protein
MKATAEETAGAFLLFEDFMTQGKTTPLHVHTNEDETLYVLDGEILVHINGSDHAVGPYGVAVAPRGVPHAFLDVADSARAHPADARHRGGVLSWPPASLRAPTPTRQARLTSVACVRRRSAPAACRSSAHRRSLRPRPMAKTPRRSRELERGLTLTTTAPHALSRSRTPAVRHRSIVVPA